MHEETIVIGGREFTVGCNEGEQAYLQTAARMLDAEARSVVEQAGRVPEARMLLMAGLMLADKTAAAEERIVELEARMAEIETELDAERRRPLPRPERVEVAVVPPGMVARLSELAARAEAIAARAEEAAPR